MFILALIAMPWSNASSTPSFGEKALPCKAKITSSLKGVRIDVPEQACNFQQGKLSEHQFSWNLVVDADVGTLDNAAPYCGSPGPSGFAPFQSVSGNGHHYNDEDGGRCMDATAEELKTTPAIGKSAFTYLWEGHNWGGASCTNEPYGEAFPPGDYTYAVELRGTRKGKAWSVKAELPIRIHP